VPGCWRVTLSHPPINTIDDVMYDEIFDLVQAIDAEPGLKVVTFESAHPDYFLAHYGVGESRSRFGTPPWRAAAIQLADSNVLSIAVIRGPGTRRRQRVRPGLRHPFRKPGESNLRSA
jgi:enoyl-CoA hydratase/carnithine racemase